MAFAFANQFNQTAWQRQLRPVDLNMSIVTQPSMQAIITLAFTSQWASPRNKCCSDLLAAGQCSRTRENKLQGIIGGGAAACTLRCKSQLLSFCHSVPKQQVWGPDNPQPAVVARVLPAHHVREELVEFCGAYIAKQTASRRSYSGVSFFWMKYSQYSLFA